MNKYFKDFTMMIATLGLYSRIVLSNCMQSFIVGVTSVLLLFAILVTKSVIPKFR